MFADKSKFMIYSRIDHSQLHKVYLKGKPNYIAAKK